MEQPGVSLAVLADGRRRAVDERISAGRAVVDDLSHTTVKLPIIIALAKQFTGTGATVLGIPASR
jgi:hypothetical protein